MSCFSVSWLSSHLANAVYLLLLSRVAVLGSISQLFLRSVAFLVSVRLSPSAVSTFLIFSCRRLSLALSCSLFRSFLVAVRLSPSAVLCYVDTFSEAHSHCSSLTSHPLLFSPFRHCSSLTSCLFLCSVAYILHTVPLSPHLFLPHCSFPPQPSLLFSVKALTTLEV